MKNICAAVVLVLVSTAAKAEQQDKSELLQRALSVIQSQRNQAMDVAAQAEVRAASLAEELVKAQARIKELEQKPESKK